MTAQPLLVQQVTTARKASQITGIVADLAGTPALARWSVETCVGRPLTGVEADRLTHHLRQVVESACRSREDQSFSRHGLRRAIRQFLSVPKDGA